MQRGELLIVYEVGKRKPLAQCLNGKCVGRYFRPQWAVRNVKNR
jgi:hypothetical protein